MFGFGTVGNIRNYLTFSPLFHIIKSMKLRVLKKALKVALANARQELAERIYISTGIDFTRPVQVYVIITERCTARCAMCHYWRIKNPQNELPAEVWIKALKELKEFAPGYHIQFTGGEPLLKEDILDILRWCGENGVSAGIVSNGELINEKLAAELVSAGLNNVNISIDSPVPEIHDELRGKPGIFRRAVEGIGYLRREAERQGHKLTISVKPTLHAKNVADMPKLVADAVEWGANVVNIQPLNINTEETNQMWINDIELLRNTVETLIAMKSEGYPIANSERQMRMWIKHFKREPIQRRTHCRVGMRLLAFRPDGSAHFCSPLRKIYGDIGTIKDQSIREIWQGEVARRIRKISVNCKLNCTASCYAERTLREKISFFFKMFLSSKPSVASTRHK